MMAINKFVSLDGIRGGAALFVLTRHSSDYFGFFLYRTYLAVDIFFLLSGFVIAHSYESKLSNGQLSARRFVLIRLIRLYPMYAISLALAFIVNGIPEPSTVLRGVFMVPVLGQDSLFPLNGVYWSLFFELVVNLVYVISRPALSDRVLLILVPALGLLLGFMGRSIGKLDIGYVGSWIHLFGGFVRATFGIFFGVLLYRHRHALWRTLPRGFGPFGATALICAVLCSGQIGRFNWAVDAASVFAVFPLCVVAASRSTPRQGLATMTLLGTASYPIYLLHPMLGQLGILIAGSLVMASAPISGFVLVGVAIGVSLTLERFLDLPIRRALSGWLLSARAPARDSRPCERIDS